MKIGGLELSSDAVLAPIAGFTDAGFRDVCARYGAGLTYTEMISCKGMVYGSEKTKELLATTDAEQIKAVQIFGNDPEIMARAVSMAEMEKFDVIDVNMGCPVPKIVRNGEGSALMNDPRLAMKIVKSVKEASGKAVTVKFRKGFAIGDNTAADFAKRMRDAGADAITVHGRTREQFYQGKADWDCIAQVAESVDIPVFANGDAVDLESYAAIKRHTGAQGVMIARGALSAPSVFMDIAKANGITTYYENADVKRDILRQIEVLRENFSERYIYSNMKKQICFYLKGSRDSKRTKEQICKVQSLEELLRTVEENF